MRRRLRLVCPPLRTANTSRMYSLLSREPDFSNGTLEDLEREREHAKLLTRLLCRKLVNVGALRSHCSVTLRAHESGVEVKTASQLEQMVERSATLRRTSGALQSIMLSLEHIYIPSVDQLIEQAKASRRAKRERPETDTDEEQHPLCAVGAARVKSEPEDRPAKRGCV